ncbi:hypothetical protein JCM10212_000702 [Sporobolomyces blumeae]
MNDFDFERYLDGRLAPIAASDIASTSLTPWIDSTPGAPFGSPTATDSSFRSTLPTPLSTSDSHSQGERLKSCAACRIRRVKCERAPGQTSCLKCIARGLACAQLPPKQRKTPARTGKRIESAQALFGDPSSTPNDSSVVLRPAKRKREASASAGPVELSPTSVVAKLVTGELEATLTGSLLDLYDQMPRGNRIPLFQATVFRPAFESCGRKLDQLDPNLELLSSVVLALAARVSDHPLLIGSSAPDAAALGTAIQHGEDLSKWGNKRVDACQALVSRAMRIADEKGAWRDPSPENLAALMMLEGMADFETAVTPRNIHPGRSIGAAYMLHLRSMLMPGTPPEIRDRLMNSGVGWTAFVRDSVLSAVSGQRSVFSDDDCCLLDDDPPVPLEKALRGPDVDPNPSNFGPHHEPFWRLFNSIMYEIALLGREASVKLTGLRASRNPRVDEPFVQRYLNSLQLTTRAFTKLEERAVRYIGPRENASGDALIVHDFVKNLRATRSGLAFLLQRSLYQRVADRTTARDGLSPAASQVAKIFELDEWQPISGPSQEDAEYWRRLDDLSAQASSLAFDAARDIVKVLEQTNDAGMAPLGAMSGAQLMFVRWPMWVSRLIDAPVGEEGGQRADWTFATKIASLETVLRAVNVLGWAYPSFTRPTPWLRSIIADLREKAHIHSSTPQPMAYVHPFDTSTTLDVLTQGLYSEFGAWNLETSETGFVNDAPVLSDAEVDALLQTLNAPAPPPMRHVDGRGEDRTDGEESIGSLANMFASLLS